MQGKCRYQIPFVALGSPPAERLRVRQNIHDSHKSEFMTNPGKPILPQLR